MPTNIFRKQLKPIESICLYSAKTSIQSGHYPFTLKTIRKNNAKHPHQEIQCPYVYFAQTVAKRRQETIMTAQNVYVRNWHGFGNVWQISPAAGGPACDRKSNNP